MKKLVLTTAALLAGTALAAAQGMNPPAGNKAEGASPAPAAQQKAPAEKAAPKQTTGQAPKAEDSKAGAQMNAESKGADTKAGAKADTKADMKNDMKAKDSKESMKKDEKADKSAASDKADSKSKMSEDNKSKMSNDKAAAQDKNGKDDNKASAKRGNKDSTTGQGAAGARHANLSGEQKTKIRTVIREKVHVKPETHVNFSINVGTRIPRTVHYHTLPTEVVSIYPAWRGYYFILVNDEIIVIEPSTFEIVAVLA